MSVQSVLFYECVCVSLHLRNGICTDSNAGKTFGPLMNIFRKWSGVPFIFWTDQMELLTFISSPLCIHLCVCILKSAGALSYIGKENWNHLNWRQNIDNTVCKPHWGQHLFTGKESIKKSQNGSTCISFVLKSLYLYVVVFFSGAPVNISLSLCLSFMSDVIWTYTRLSSLYLQHLC